MVKIATFTLTDKWALGSAHEDLQVQIGMANSRIREVINCKGGNTQIIISLFLINLLMHPPEIFYVIPLQHKSGKFTSKLRKVIKRCFIEHFLVHPHVKPFFLGCCIWIELDG